MEKLLFKNDWINIPRTWDGIEHAVCMGRLRIQRIHANHKCLGAVKHKVPDEMDNPVLVEVTCK